MSINPKIFDKTYYYNVCLGSEEFKKSGGRKLHPKVKQMVDKLPLNKMSNVLEIGCGRGDTALYLARKVRSITAIDYSPAAITIAKNIRKNYSKKIQEKTRFIKMKATNLNFKENSFDCVLFIDTIDHLSKKEQEQTLKEITRVLKNNGFVFIRTCSNRILLSHVYRYYTYPLNKFVTWIDKKIKGIEYKSLPKDSRTPEEKQQHINEPDYFYLRTLLKKYFKTIELTAETGFLKEGKGLRTSIYNFIVALYPFSQYFPLSILFGHSFLCFLKNPKK